LFLYITPGCIQYRECTQAQPTGPGAYGPSQPLHPAKPTQPNRRLPPPLLRLFTSPPRLRLFHFPGPPRTAQFLLFPGDVALAVAVVRSLPFPSSSIPHAPAPAPPHFSANGSRQNRLFARDVDRERRRSPRRSSLRARPSCKRIRSLSRFSVPMFWICFVIFGNRLVNPIFSPSVATSIIR
jgi:hypothetical protein